MDSQPCWSEINPYATALKAKWKPIIMSGFASLKTEEVDAIMKYVDDYTPPVKTPDTTASGAPVESDNSLLFGIFNSCISTGCLYIITSKQ